MKLKNKFISLAAAAAATVGIVTPLSLTSCKSSDSFDMEEISEMGTPSFDQYDGEELLNWHDATWAYADYMSEHPQDFIEDLKWGTMQNWYSFYDESSFPQPDEYGRQFTARLHSIKFGATTPTFGFAEVSEPGEKPIKYPTVSIKYKVQVDATAVIKEHKTVLTHDLVYTTEVEYKNMIFFAYPTARNDKTGGLNSYSELLEPTWFITFATDSDTQSVVADHVGWSIEYNSNFVDNMEMVSGRSIEHRTREGSASDIIETNQVLEEYARYKSYQYDSRQFIVDDKRNPSFVDINPNTGWEAWYNQNPESIIANSIMLDSASWYLANVPVNAYVETGPMSALVNYGVDGDGEEIEIENQDVYLTNWTLQLPHDYQDIDTGTEELQLEIGHYNQNEIWEGDDGSSIPLTANGLGTRYDAGGKERKIWFNIPKGGIYYSQLSEELVDWEGFELNGGKVNFAVPAILNYGFKENPTWHEIGEDGDGLFLTDDHSLQFYLPQTYYFKATISYEIDGDEESHTWLIPLGFNRGYDIDLYFQPAPLIS